MICRGVARAEIFHTPSDYREFLALFRQVVDRFFWRAFAFCLMPNHVHLVISASREELSWGMHRLNGLYAQRFNRRYGRDGHLFQNRFGVRLVTGERHLRRVCRYVYDNPERARLCTEESDWPWRGIAAF